MLPSSPSSDSVEDSPKALCLCHMQHRLLDFRPIPSLSTTSVSQLTLLCGLNCSLSTGSCPCCGCCCCVVVVTTTVVLLLIAGRAPALAALMSGGFAAGAPELFVDGLSAMLLLHAATRQTRSGGVRLGPCYVLSLCPPAVPLRSFHHAYMHSLHSIPALACGPVT